MTGNRTTWLHQHDYLGLELDWLAVDADGSLGFFSSAGRGAVPSTCLPTCSELHAVTSIVETLPVVSEVEVLVSKYGEHQSSGRPASALDWLEVARRGIWAFDYDLNSRVGGYRQVVRPHEPLPLAALEADAVLQLARSVRLTLRLASVEWLLPGDDAVFQS
ncbi:MAG: hypothetical protein AAF533_22905 [Acidobacteriota bacterium]